MTQVKCNDSPQCLLRNDTFKESMPSLHECYQYTKASCCTTAHDEKIKDGLISLVSDTCHENFDDLLQYYCFGCYQSQPQYTDVKAKTIRICKSFANRIWGGLETGDISKQADVFDNCGLNVDDKIVIQSKYFTDGTQFFAKVKPPFFEDYKVIIDEKDENCYNFGLHRVSLQLSSLALMIVGLFGILNYL
ncbi:UNKNOWN [Stylonychia lemnae]|uniref:Folate receptor-like domain-containing protein n=1 Tax=Stylonychia lemnae TaxID=5949 RepID=A0A077ZT41_STYLE|nr:UNKNOWN [Stylonychia lemnae]|eukprot:CDW73053.1 UNKNOWN [Stylonychia lemnae]